MLKYVWEVTGKFSHIMSYLHNGTFSQTQQHVSLCVTQLVCLCGLFNIVNWSEIKANSDRQAISNRYNQCSHARKGQATCGAPVRLDTMKFYRVQEKTGRSSDLLSVNIGL